MHGRQRLLETAITGRNCVKEEAMGLLISMWQTTTDTLNLVVFAGGASDACGRLSPARAYG